MTTQDTPSPSTTAHRRGTIFGFGSIYKRGRVWWVRYHHRGREFRESSGSPNPAEAAKLLHKRYKEIAQRRFVGPAEDRVRLAGVSQGPEAGRDLVEGLVPGDLLPLRVRADGPVGMSCASAAA